MRLADAVRLRPGQRPSRRRPTRCVMNFTIETRVTMRNRILNTSALLGRTAAVSSFPALTDVEPRRERYER
jgi:hypothetical protein